MYYSKNKYLFQMGQYSPTNKNIIIPIKISKTNYLFIWSLFV